MFRPTSLPGRQTLRALILGAIDREVACSRLPLEASPITLRCGSRSDRFVVASLIKDASANIEWYLAARGEAELVAQDAVVGAIASTQDETLLALGLSPLDDRVLEEIVGSNRECLGIGAPQERVDALIRNKNKFGRYRGAITIAWKKA